MNVVNAFCNVVSYIGKVGDFGYKIFRMGEAAVDIHQVHTDQELSKFEKAHRIATDAIVITGGAVDVVNTIKPSLLSSDPEAQAKIKVGISVVTGGGDIAATISRKSCKEGGLSREDYIEIADVIFMRTADTLQLGLKQEVLQNYLKGINSPRVQKIINNKETIQKIQNGIQKLVALRNTAHFWHGLWTKGPIVVKKIKDRWAPSPSTPVHHGISPDLLDLPEDDLEYVMEFQELLTQDLDHFETIPEMLEDVFKKEKYPICPLTKRPVRFVLSVADFRPPYPTVYYEKEALDTWIQKHPHEPPVGWPKGVAYVRVSISRDAPKQKQINDFLDKNLRELRQVYNENK